MLQNNGSEYYCLSLSLSSPEVDQSPLSGELKVYMPWYALKDGDDGGTWGIGGMATCEVGMGIIIITVVHDNVAQQIKQPVFSFKLSSALLSLPLSFPIFNLHQCGLHLILLLC